MSKAQRLHRLAYSLGLYIYYIISFNAHAQAMKNDDCSKSCIELEQFVEAEVENDLATIILFAEVSDADAGKSSAKGNELLNKQIQKIGADKTLLSKHATQISTSIQYNGEGRPSSWKTRAQVTLESKNFIELSKIAARFTPDFAYESIQYHLSSTAMQQIEQQMIIQAIAQFQEKSALISSAFGFKNYQLKKIQIIGIHGHESSPYKPILSSRAILAATPSTTFLESGKSNVRVTVRGSISVE